jgi:hypothetical protein
MLFLRGKFNGKLLNCSPKNSKKKQTNKSEQNSEKPNIITRFLIGLKFDNSILCLLTGFIFKFNFANYS